MSAQKAASGLQAACVRCRQGKIKCIRPSNADACKRCARDGTACVVPELRMGRQKGARNKHHGLARSYHQVSGAIAQLQKGTLDAESAQTLRDLKALLQATELPAASTPTAQRLSVAAEKVSISPSRSSSEDSYVESALEDVENPLELLAQASRLYSRINTSQLVTARPVPEQNFAPPPWTMSSLTSSLDVSP